AARPKADRRRHPPGLHHGGHLGLHGFGGPFHCAVEDGRLRLVGRDGGQEFGDLLGVPAGAAGRRGGGHPTPGPVEISPAVEHPMVGTSPAASAIPALSSARSYRSEQNTTTSLAPSPARAAVAAPRPAARASGSAD